MFITEQQLLELKYKPNGKYYMQPLCEIFSKELSNINEKFNLDLEVAIQPFFHRLIGKGWQVKFVDNSVLYFEQVEKDNGEKGYNLHFWPSPDEHLFHKLVDRIF